ncbi:MAG TPA: RNA 2',3'-cyclic phosphodiesterase [Burkholderiales bacterium]|nr:RNA 2',3'-cyclic phosphodiesterase [Burkholderiales bacterium]
MAARSARLFFAAWPPPDVQGALGTAAQALQRECGGRAVPARNIHLTRVFLGSVAREHHSRLEKLAAAARAPRFELRLDRVAWWRHNRIVWAGVPECPLALSALVEQLERGLSSAGFHFDRRPYAAHITLVRNARRAPARATAVSVTWPVNRFALMESAASGQGRAYDMLLEWPLTA